MPDLLKLDGRIVVVSGAGGGGIGTTVTRMAAEAGATVVAVSRSEENLAVHVAPRRFTRWWPCDRCRHFQKLANMVCAKRAHHAAVSNQGRTDF